MALHSLALTLQEVADRLELAGKKPQASKLRRVAKKVSYSPVRRLDKGELKAVRASFPEIRDLMAEAQTDEDRQFAQRVSYELQSIGLSLEVQ